MIDLESYRSLDSLPGFLHWQEGCALLEFAATWKAHGCIVELGSFLGKSTAFLVEGAKLYDDDPHVWAVDHWKGSSEHQIDAQHPIIEIVNGEDLFKKFIRIMADGEWLKFIYPIVCNHVEAASHFTDGEVRLLFIDGEHDYESTKANFEAWKSRVSQGGLIVFHDNDAAHEGVQKLVSEIKLQRVDAPKSLAAFVKD